ncbi:unnamed protein product [Rodentolepis nana]|uniref:LAM_G_DOMAIN domain-containing protein n=1 Tax=Rodentolepis nana TaxID=102285 RepID=A0A0R3TA68_RODNA|nr:unnamed protein product [Rodentolepis nana]
MPSQTSPVSRSNQDEDNVTQPLSKIMCNCELCYARLSSSTRQATEEDTINYPDLFDPFHYSSNLMPNYLQFDYIIPFTPAYGDTDVVFPKNLKESSTPEVLQIEDDAIATAGPHLYLSKESIIHLKLSTYVVLERSENAVRLINYRNNSALALSENGKYGFIYHFNCRGLINIHHEKLAITFNKDRQILLRSTKPSFVKKENEFYRLTKRHWIQCRPVEMDAFEQDRTPEILEKSGLEKSEQKSKLLNIINSSTMKKTPGGLMIQLGNSRLEHSLNGDVSLSWMYGEQLFSLTVSPLTGGLSLSARNLEISITAKNDIYITFADFFAYTSSRQMTVSTGALTSRLYGTKQHPCVLKLVTNNLDDRDLPQYCQHASQTHNVSNKHRGNGRFKNRKYKNTHQKETPTVAQSDITETEDLNPQTMSESSCEHDPQSSEKSSFSQTTENNL